MTKQVSKNYFLFQDLGVVWGRGLGGRKKTFWIIVKTLYNRKESLEIICKWESKDYAENEEEPRDNWDLFQENWKRGRKNWRGPPLDLKFTLSLTEYINRSIAESPENLAEFGIWKLRSLLEMCLLFSNVETFSSGFSDWFTFSFP